MGQSFAIDGLPGLLLLLVPVAALVIVVIWALRQSRAKPPRMDQTDPHISLRPPPLSTSSAESDVTTVASTPEVRKAETLVAQPSPRVDPPPVAAAAPAVAPEALAAAIAKLEAGGDQSELAHLYIRQASAYVAQGQTEEAGSRLRDAIRVAALNGLAGPHALARVELGELYFNNGDPITACEQWQIARNLFHDLARPDDRDDVDKRMLANGCPTDWVLTDF